MRVWCWWQPQLLEDVRDVLFDRALGDEDAPRDRDVREPFGHQFEHLSFARAQLCEWVVTAAAADELGDDARVERGAAVGDPAHGAANSPMSETRSLSR